MHAQYWAKPKIWNFYAQLFLGSSPHHSGSPHHTTLARLHIITFNSFKFKTMWRWWFKRTFQEFCAELTGQNSLAGSWTDGRFKSCVSVMQKKRNVIDQIDPLYCRPDFFRACTNMTGCHCDWLFFCLFPDYYLWLKYFNSLNKSQQNHEKLLLCFDPLCTS